MVEGTAMSIINKMHQELNRGDDAPILAEMPDKKGKNKVLLFGLISLLLASSIGLSYLIYNKKEERVQVTEEKKVVEFVEVVVPPQTLETEVQSVTVITSSPVISVTAYVNEEKISNDKVVLKTATSPVPVVKVVTPAASSSTESSKPVVTKKPVAKKTEVKVAASKAKPVKSKPKAVKKTSHLEVKTATLTNAQLADLHLQKAEKAMLKGDSLLASQEKNKALIIQPDLHEERKALALYYYGVGEQVRAENILKKGAVQFPEYSDFNLMLSRIALKNGDQKKAYLYLNQYPPKVQGNLDYHVSYAILAQKLGNSEQAETLYQGLLTQRPNNGRWLMSLALSQDKQGKESVAVENYQKALLQIDLSSNAKNFINQRLTYLANQ